MVYLIIMSHNYQCQQKQKLGFNYNACYIANDLDRYNMIVLNKIYQDNFIRLIQAKLFENDNIKRIFYFWNWRESRCDFKRLQIINFRGILFYFACICIAEYYAPVSCLNCWKHVWFSSYILTYFSRLMITNNFYAV